MSTENLNIRFSPRALNWIAIVTVAAVAILLRVYALDRLPPGLFGDEAVEGLDALDVLAGNFAIWFHAHLGREPLYVYLTALSYWAFGVTALATRLPAVIAGLLTIPATFLLVREWGRTAFGEAEASPASPEGHEKQATVIASPRFSRAKQSPTPAWRLLRSPAGGRGVHDLRSLAMTDRGARVAFFATALIAISFWHVQMTRDAHRDTLLPLVEAIGYWLLWRGIRNNDWRMFATAGGMLGLAVYTYSPGRFVGVFVALFFIIEWAVQWLTKRRQHLSLVHGPSSLAIASAAFAALVVMLPLGMYFAQNPVQFTRRFESVSVLDADSPPFALGQSIVGNLAQFVLPGAGYQSKHYNLPGRPVFDLLIAPWFLAGIGLAIARWRQTAYRFLLLWFAVMMTPAFLTADMIPKGVRALGVVPGVFIFPALAMDAAIVWVGSRWSQTRAAGENLRHGESYAPANDAAIAHARNTRLLEYALPTLLVVSLLGSAAWTAFDYFNAWANLPELPFAFDADLVEVSQFLQQQPADHPVYISSEVYRPPTEMLLGRRVATTHYTERATRVREFDAKSTLVFGRGDDKPIYLFVREQAPQREWLARLAQVKPAGEGSYLAAVELLGMTPPKYRIDISVDPYRELIGYTPFDRDPRGLALYWSITQLPADRSDLQTSISLADASGAVVTQEKHLFGYPPLEWALGDTVIEWFSMDIPDSAAHFSIELSRNGARWQSPPISLR